MMFSFDYFSRLACSPFCRHAIFDRDWHLSSAVPENVGGRAGLTEGHHMSPPHRLWTFVNKPMNVIDALAIAPFWLTLLVGNLIPFPLAFLRALRLLRFLRIMKIGKFDSTLMVLGTTLAKSLESVEVLLVYCILISLVSGAILNQVEPHDGKDNPFKTVPAASWWVLARILWMRHSSPWSEGYPKTLIGSYVNIVYLILKNIIWALPFGQIGQIFNEEWKEIQQLQKIRKDVEMEDADSMDTLWLHNGKAAVTEIEVWNVSNHSLGGKGAVPVPILESTASSAVVTTALWGGTLKRWCGNPSMDFEVSWHPAEVKEGKSRGELCVTPLQGRRFNASHAWRCVIKAPLRLYGHQAQIIWESQESSSGPSPEWEGPGGKFQIDWDAKAAQEAAAQSRSEIDSTMQQVLALLEERGRKLEELSHNTSTIEQRTTAIEKIVLPHD